MNFTLRQLEFFIVLAQEKQISKAATRCHISQSSMTVAMRNLEEALHSQLFLRQPKGVQLTPAGERFLLHARKIINDSLHAIEDLHYQPELAGGQIVIGIAKTLSAYLLPSIISEVEQHFPLMAIQFVEGDPAELIKNLRDNKLAFALVLTSNISHDSGFKIETFIRSQRRLWVAQGHSLLSKASVKLSDLENMPFIMLDTDKYPDVIGEHWASRGGQPNISFTTTSFEAVRSLVAKAKGVTILSDLVYRPWSLEGLRVMRKTIEDSVTFMDVGAVMPQGGVMVEADRAVLDYLRGAIIRLDDNA